MDYDAVVVGSGPNGFAAAITLAEAGLSVLMFEAKDTIGGGMRSGNLTLPGFTHDICAAILPLAIASPCFRNLPLAQHGLEWIEPPTPLAHPYDDGTAALLQRSIDATTATLDVEDGKAYKQLFEPFLNDWEQIESDLLGPLHFPQHPLTMARIGWYALHSAKGLSKALFKGKKARGLFSGLAAHSILPLEKPITASFALILGILGHKVGWPIVKGGTQKLADALASYFLSLGGEIITGVSIDSLKEVPESRVVLLDITPRQFLSMTNGTLPWLYRYRLKQYRYGPGAFKIDWALNQPIPWKAQECAQAGTVHIGGTLDDIAFSERQVWKGRYPVHPFVLLAQPSLFDPTRAPEGKHTAWAYCHVPNGSTVDMTAHIEEQVERFAPGFGECILARNTITASALEQYNPNYIGGDIIGGVQDLSQLFTRPVARLDPYSTPLPGVYFCSSSTPPGGGVHGMCGFHAAQSALRYITRK